MRLTGAPRLSEKAWKPDQVSDLNDMWLDLRQAFADRLFLNPQPFALLPSPIGVEGMVVAVTDSTTNTFGATIAGGGLNHVLGWSNGVHWTVIGI